MKRRSNATAYSAAALLIGLTVTACAGGNGETPSAVAAPTTPTVTVVSTAPTTIRTTDEVTATVTETEVKTSTLTPKPAGTSTVVKTKEVVKTATATVTAEPPAPAGTFGDGTYIVGEDIQPGTYRSSNSSPAGDLDLCYWEIRTSDGSIAENGVNDGVMFVGPEAFSVRTEGCGTWSPVG